MHRGMSADANKPFKEVAVVKGQRDQKLVFKVHGLLWSSRDQKPHAHGT